jgi:hypothetical protein
MATYYDKYIDIINVRTWYLTLIVNPQVHRTTIQSTVET